MANTVMLTYDANIEKAVSGIRKLQKLSGNIQTSVNVNPVVSVIKNKSRQVKNDIKVLSDLQRSLTPSGVKLLGPAPASKSSDPNLSFFKQAAAEKQIKAIAEVRHAARSTFRRLQVIGNRTARVFGTTLTNAIDRSANSVSRLDRMMTGMSGAANSLRSMTFATVGAFFALKRAQKDIILGLKEMEIRSIFMRKEFVSMIDSAGNARKSADKFSGATFLSDLRNASFGLVKDTVLIEESQNAIAAGLDPEHAKKLITIATALSKVQSGFASSSAVADIFTGIMRQSPRILDNLHKAFGKFGPVITDSLKGITDPVQKLRKLVSVFGDNALPIIREMGLEFDKLGTSITDRVIQGFIKLENFGQGVIRVFKGIGIAAAGISLPAIFGGIAIGKGAIGLGSALGGGLLAKAGSSLMTKGFIGRIVGVAMQVMASAIPAILTIILGIVPFALGALGIVGLRAGLRERDGEGPSFFDKFKEFTGGFLISNIDSFGVAADKFLDTGKLPETIKVFKNSLTSLLESFSANKEQVESWLSVLLKVTIAGKSFAREFLKPIDAFLEKLTGKTFGLGGENGPLSSIEKARDLFGDLGERMGSLTSRLADFGIRFLTMVPKLLDLFSGIITIGQAVGLIDKTENDIKKEEFNKAFAGSKSLFGNGLSGFDVGGGLVAELPKQLSDRSAAFSEINKNLHGFQPRVETILSGDGITNKMIQAIQEVTKDRNVTQNEMRLLREKFGESMNIIKDALVSLSEKTALTLTTTDLREQNVTDIMMQR